MRVSWTICPGWPWTLILLISASRVARIHRCEPLHQAYVFEFKDWIHVVSVLRELSLFFSPFLFWKWNFIIYDNQWLCRLNISKSNMFILILFVDLEFYLWSPQSLKRCKISHVSGPQRNVFSLHRNASTLRNYLHIHFNCV
jgi:hypothetical protein